MKLNLRTNLVLISFCLFASSALAQTDRNYTGLGLVSCREFIAAYKEDSNSEAVTLVISWAQGFMNGFNTARIRLRQTYFNTPPPRSIGNFLNGGCKASPNTDVLEVSIQTSIFLLQKEPIRAP